MKKALLFALYIACIANAAPYLTINESAAPGEIALTGPSDELSFGCDIDDGLIGGTIDFVLSNEQGSLDSSGVTLNPDYSTVGYMYPWDFSWVVNDGTTPQYVSITGGNFNMSNNNIFWLMRDLIFHCEGPDDVTISMYAGVGGIDYIENDIPQGTLLGSVLIHQIPEPMTIALLSLGGLFLRRRKDIPGI